MIRRIHHSEVFKDRAGIQVKAEQDCPDENRN